MPLSDTNRRILMAAAKTVFPPGGAFETDGVEAKVVDYLDDYLDRLTFTDRAQLLVFFRAFDIGLAWTQKDPRARFHTADPITQREYLSSWESSRRYTQRMAFQGLRMVLTMAYAECADVQVAMGLPVNTTLTDELRTLARTGRKAATETR